MVPELLWKRAVRKSIEQVRREPRRVNFEQACDLSDAALANLRNYLRHGELLAEQELQRRVSRFLIERERIERRMAQTWRKVVVQ